LNIINVIFAARVSLFVIVQL